MDKYKIIKKYLHKSYYSELIKAFNQNGDICMIKKIPLYCGSTEIDILSEIKHPNIVKYYESFRDSKYRYLVQEYIDGSTLEDTIKNLKKPMLNKDIKTLIIELTRSIKYLNHQNIYHLDIRPCNLMYDYQKKITLIDFGCSQKNISEKIIEKNYFGIMNHLPPEFIKNNSNLDKVDIWGIGIILYYVIFKTMPIFFSNTNIENIKNENKIYLNLLKNILVEDPKKRYSLKQIDNFIEKI